MYSNHRGKVERRRVRPIRMWFGVTAFHRDAGWLLEAFCLDRQETRDFSMSSKRGDIMSTPALGMMYVPHYEWWLHHHPFKIQWRDNYRCGTCPMCESDSGCLIGCPQNDIERKLEEINCLARDWFKRQR